MTDTNIRKGVLLDAINDFIVNGCGKRPIVMCELDEVIRLVRQGVGNDGVIAACKLIREVTKVNESILWTTEFVNSDTNGFIKYVLDNGIPYTGTAREGTGITLKEAVDIVRFIKANMHLITE
jgi:hypothetical protein